MANYNYVENVVLRSSTTSFCFIIRKIPRIIRELQYFNVVVNTASAMLIADNAKNTILSFYTYCLAT